MFPVSGCIATGNVSHAQESILIKCDVDFHFHDLISSKSHIDSFHLFCIVNLHPLNVLV